MHQCRAELCHLGVRMLTAEKCEKGHLMVRISGNHTGFCAGDDTGFGDTCLSTARVGQYLIVKDKMIRGMENENRFDGVAVSCAA